MTVFVGVDPGLTGAVAFIGPRGAFVVDMPTRAIEVGFGNSRIDGRALAVLVRRHVPVDEVPHVTCEAVRIMGNKANTAQSKGSLMRSLGAIEGVFDTLRYRLHMVEPQAWQKLYGLSGKKVEERAKGALHPGTLKACSLYPQVAPDLRRVKDHNRAEALLIAHYGKAQHA